MLKFIGAFAMFVWLCGVFYLIHKAGNCLVKLKELELEELKLRKGF